VSFIGRFVFKGQAKLVDYHSAYATLCARVPYNAFHTFLRSELQRIAIKHNSCDRNILNDSDNMTVADSDLTTVDNSGKTILRSGEHNEQK